VKPWLPVPPSYKTHNVDTEKKDPNSVLSFYRQLLALRHHEPALLEGNYIALNEDDPNVLTFVRQYKNEAILVALNMSAGQQKLLLDLSALGFNAPKLSMLLTDFHKGLPSAANDLAMEPYSVFIAKLTK
jgi:alpha-glucosidase